MLHGHGRFRRQENFVTVDTDGATISRRGRIDTGGSSARRSVVIGDALATITHERVLFSALDGLTLRTDVAL